VLALLMVSTIKYPKFPPIGFRSVRGWTGIAVFLVILVGGLRYPRQFLFPLGLAYLTFGVARGFFLALLERGDAVPIPADDLLEPAPHEPQRFTGPRRVEPDSRRQEKAE
jgi:hypothetical protein